MYLRQSTLASVILGPMADISGVLFTGSIPSGNVRASKNGAAFAGLSSNSGAVHRESGRYMVPLSTTDTNTLGQVDIYIEISGCRSNVKYDIVTSNWWDSMFSTDQLQVDVVQIVGSTPSGQIISYTTTAVTPIVPTTGQIGTTVTASVPSTGQIASAVPTLTQITSVIPTTGQIGTAVAASVPNTGQIKTQMVNALSSDIYYEPSSGTPGSGLTLAEKIGYMSKMALNKSTQTATQYSLYNYGGTNIDQRAVTADDGATFTRNRIIGG